MILDERGFDNFEDWADRTAGFIDRYGDPPTVISAKDWKRWASAVCQMPGIVNQNPPHPESYAHWRSWAIDLNQSVNV